MHRNHSAFTLIELLVVIAIIAMLLAIIAPSLKLAQERAQFIFCKVNLRSYGLTMKLYLNEHDDKYPECSTSMFNGLPPGTPSINCQWHNKDVSPNVNPQYAGPLWPYMDSDKAHMCPTFKRFAGAYGAQHPPYQNSTHPAYPAIEPQYAFSQNAFLGRPYGVLKESEVVNTADVLVWVEETIWLIPRNPPYTWAGWVLNDTCFFSRHDDDTVGWGDFIATYHSTSLAKPDDGMGNAVFVDGSVRLLDPYEVVNIPGGKEARAGFIHSWPLKGKLSSTKPY